MGLVVKLALCLAWFYEGFFILLASVTAATLLLKVKLHPLLVLAYLTLLPYIFFMGILPARTLRKAINSGHPNRMLWWVGATWINFGTHFFVLTLVKWRDNYPPLLAHSSPILIVYTIVIVTSQAVVLTAYCNLRRALPMQAMWDFPTFAEEERKSKNMGEREFWKRPRVDEGGERRQMEEEAWRQYMHAEEERRRDEEKANQRRSEGGRTGREGGGVEGRESIEEGGKVLDEVSRILSSTSHQQLLKVDQGATGDEVRSAFRQLALLVHPDKNNDPRAGEAFAKLQKAYQCLASA